MGNIHLAQTGSASADVIEEGRSIDNKCARCNLHEDEQHNELMVYLVEIDAKIHAYQQSLTTVLEVWQLRQSQDPVVTEYLIRRDREFIKILEIFPKT